MLIPLMFIIMIVCFVLSMSGSLPLGIAFIIAIILFLFCLLTMAEKNTHFTFFGKIYMIVSFLIIVYCVCIMFFDIDLAIVLFNN